MLPRCSWYYPSITAAAVILKLYCILCKSAHYQNSIHIADCRQCTGLSVKKAFAWLVGALHTALGHPAVSPSFLPSLDYLVGKTEKDNWAKKDCFDCGVIKGQEISKAIFLEIPLPKK